MPAIVNPMPNEKQYYIANIELENKIPSQQFHYLLEESRIAINDLLTENLFIPSPDIWGDVIGPFHIFLSLQDNRLKLNIEDDYYIKKGVKRIGHIFIPISSLKAQIKDYFYLCDSYHNLQNQLSPYKLEAIDMGRRGLHNEAAEKLVTILQNKVEIDFDTARRLFTLICALHRFHI